MRSDVNILISPSKWLTEWHVCGRLESSPFKSHHFEISRNLTMMTSSKGSIFRVTGLCAGKSPVSGEFPSQRAVTQSFDFALICAWINGWVNNRKAGYLRRHRAHYDVIVMSDVEIVAPFSIQSLSFQAWVFIIKKDVRQTVYNGYHYW